MHGPGPGHGHVSVRIVPILHVAFGMWHLAFGIVYLACCMFAGIASGNVGADVQVERAGELRVLDSTRFEEVKFSDVK